MENEKKITRKSNPAVKVYCLPEERSRLKKQAQSTGYTLSTFMLKVSLGHRVESILDNKRVEDLARISGDLGRLGGLLKLWLSDEARTAQVGELTIRATLFKIARTQDQILDVMRAVVFPKTRR